MDDARFFIGHLAERTGVTPDTVRYYERIGVMPEPSRTPSGYRIYAPDDVERLEFVRRAQALGLTLEEIAEALSLVERGREPCDHVRERLARRLEQTRIQMRELRRLETRLAEALDRAQGAAQPEAACRCYIIEGMPRLGGG